MQNLSLEYLKHHLRSAPASLKNDVLYLALETRWFCQSPFSSTNPSESLWKLGTYIPSSRRRKTSPIFEKEFGLPMKLRIIGGCAVFTFR